MKSHPTELQLQDLSFGRLATAESIRLQRHLFNCPPCLKRLIEIETVMAFAEQVSNFSPVVNKSKPLFIVHHTGDGMIYSRTMRKGRKWLARHWGKQLDGGRICETIEEANRYLFESFEQMFPEHRCTTKCQTNPKHVSAPFSR